MMGTVFNKRFYTQFGIAFVTIVLLQWLHFTLYFNQPAGVSMIWSVVDWTIWFVLFAGLLHLFTSMRDKPNTVTLLAIVFVLLAGIVQVVVASGVYYLLFEPDKTLLASIAKSLNKRWLQHLMIASVMVLLAQLRVVRLSKMAAHREMQPLNLFDGKHHYRVSQCEIVAVVANKNYLSVYTNEQEIVLRSTLKEFVQQLDAQRFTPVSRSAVVNKDGISGLFKYSKSSYKVQLHNQLECNVSKTYLPQIQNMMT